MAGLFRAFLLVCALPLAAVALAGAQAESAPPAAPAAKPAPAVKPAAPPCVAIPGRKMCMDALEYTKTRFADFLTRHGNDCGGQPCYDDADPAARLRQRDGAWAVDAGFEEHPAALVTWFGAKAACEDAGQRLCTPDEWTTACRGPKDTPLPYGTVFDLQACNGFEGKRRTTAPVGSLKGCHGGYPGLYDMSGNVWEWTSVCAKGVCEARGGSYHSYVNYVVCTYIDRFHADIGEKYVGFRCCRSQD